LHPTSHAFSGKDFAIILLLMAEDWRAASIERVLYKAEFTVMGILVVGLLGLLLLVLGTLFAVYLGIRLFQGKPTPRNAWHAIPGECPTCGVEVARDAPDGLCPRCLLRQAIVEPAALRSGSTPATGAYPAAFGPSAVEQRPLHFPTTPPTGPYQGTFGAPDIGQLAEHFPNLEILDLLGQGGMGAVYKARQTKLDRLVALKILPPEAGRDVAFAERFTREAQALARLGHPNIVGIYDFGEAGGFFYVVMEYVDGPNLRQLLRTGRMDSAQVFRIVSQLCDALQYAHDEGIVHRDIKPENILIDQKGRVKVADFGLAKLLHRTPADYRITLTATGQVMGTIHYMAPEQIERPQTVDHRADLYALGVVFYEMLAGELPLGRFSLPSQKGLADERIDNILIKALEKDPDARYQQAGSIKADLGTGGPSVPMGPLAEQGGLSLQDRLDQEDLRYQVMKPACSLQPPWPWSFG
jgi:tRNA A-37 threonylcarbamoyl transferase component Bud32